MVSPGIWGIASWLPAAHCWQLRWYLFLLLCILGLFLVLVVLFVLFCGVCLFCFGILFVCFYFKFYFLMYDLFWSTIASLPPLQICLFAFGLNNVPSPSEKKWWHVIELLNFSWKLLLQPHLILIKEMLCETALRKAQVGLLICSLICSVPVPVCMVISFVVFSPNCWDILFFL